MPDPVRGRTFLDVERLQSVGGDERFSIGNAAGFAAPLHCIVLRLLELIMSREITSHKVNGLNDALLVNVLDDPGQGNACHEYQIRRWVTNTGDQHDDEEFCSIKFQNGPINEVGVNGISNEALLAIVEDRLKGFQSGDYACRENALALTKLQEAIMWLHSRTRERVARNVEGTHAV